MNKKLLALVATGLLCTTGVSAHDFEVDGIYYNIMSEEDKTVEVTYQGGAYTSYKEYSGAVNIPTIVSYDAQEYSVIRIGDNAFRDCYNLTSVGIPNGVVSIGDGAFFECKGLASLIIPGSVTNIEDAAFRMCSGLNSIVVAIDNPVYDSREGCNAIIESANNMLVVGCESTTIPYGVTHIGIYAFTHCSGLTSVTIPSSVTKIGDNAFNCCTGLTSVTIPGSVTKVEWNAFIFCINLTSVVIQDGVESIGTGAFQFCEKLEVVELPASVTSIGGSAFADCENLELIQIAPENGVYCSFNSEGIWGVYSKDMSELIAVPAGTTGELVIPETVKSVNNGVCDGCRNLTSLVIPASVSHIGDYAFADCEGITSITSNIPADKLFSISGTVFDKVDKTNITLNVPYGAQAAYASKEGWSGFANIVEMDPTPFNLTVSSAGYATLYLDYTAQIPEGVSVYTANEVEGNLLKMELVEGVLPANTGVVVKAPAGTYTFTYSDTYAPEISDNLFKGSATYEYVDVASTQTAFVLSKVDGEVGMYPAKLTDGRFLNNANKAYLLLTTKLGVSDEELDTSVGGSQLSLRFDFGGTTGVDKVQTESGADAVIYDLYGRKVNKATTPGFYIINNKKVWVK